MNYFTKEELKILFLELNIATRNWCHDPNYKGYASLKEKIYSMINNYEESKQMKCKKLTTAEDAFEWLRQWLLELMDEECQGLMVNISTLNEFQRGSCSGTYGAYQELAAQLRSYLKHGFEHLEIENYENCNEGTE